MDVHTGNMYTTQVLYCSKCNSSTLLEEYRGPHPINSVDQRKTAYVSPQKFNLCITSHLYVGVRILIRFFFRNKGEELGCVVLCCAVLYCGMVWDDHVNDCTQGEKDHGFPFVRISLFVKTPLALSKPPMTAS